MLSIAADPNRRRRDLFAFAATAASARGESHSTVNSPPPWRSVTRAVAGERTTAVTPVLETWEPRFHNLDEGRHRGTECCERNHCGAVGQTRFRGGAGGFRKDLDPQEWAVLLRDAHFQHRPVRLGIVVIVAHRPLTSADELGGSWPRS